MHLPSARSGPDHLGSLKYKGEGGGVLPSATLMMLNQDAENKSDWFSSFAV